MAHITLSVPEKLKQELDEFKEINWSEVARAALSEKARRQRLFRAIEELMDSKPESEAGRTAKLLLSAQAGRPLDKELLARLHDEILKSSSPEMSEEEFEKWAVETVRKGRKGRLEELKRTGLVK